MQLSFLKSSAIRKLKAFSGKGNPSVNMQNISLGYYYKVDITRIIQQHTRTIYI